MESSLAVSYKVKHTLTLWSSNFKSRFLLKRNENVCPQKELHMNVPSGLNHNSVKLEAIQFISRWMDKWSGISYNWLLPINKNEQVSHIYNKTDDSQKYAEQKKPDTKEANPNYWIYEVLDQAKLSIVMKKSQTSGWLGQGGEGVVGCKVGMREHFLYFDVVIVVRVYIYMCVCVYKTHQMHI